MTAALVSGTCGVRWALAAWDKWEDSRVYGVAAPPRCEGVVCGRHPPPHQHARTAVAGGAREPSFLVSTELSSLRRWQRDEGTV